MGGPCFLIPCVPTFSWLFGFVVTPAWFPGAHILVRSACCPSCLLRLTAVTRSSRRLWRKFHSAHICGWWSLSPSPDLKGYNWLQRPSYVDPWAPGFLCLFLPLELSGLKVLALLVTLFLICCRFTRLIQCIF